MLTGLVEKGRNKCELYFPLGKKDEKAEQSYIYVKTTKVRDKFTFDSKNTVQYDVETHAFQELNEVTFGKYNIKYVNKTNLNECQVRQLQIKKKDCEPRTIYHYWFSDWPDHKMANPEQVLQIALEVLKIMESYKKADANTNDMLKNSDESLTNNVRKQDLKPKLSHDNFPSKKESALALFKKNPPQERRKSNESIKLPVIVHCSAGIGRTGCFLAILNGIQQLKCNNNVDVLAILCSLRLNRGGMVQTAEQYELIHRVLSLYTERHE